MRPLLRLIAAAFCWLTAAYAFLCGSAFAYQQFIRPRVFHWIGSFADSHAYLYWLWLVAALASISSEFRAGSSSRRLAAAFAAVWTGVGLWNLAYPIVPSLDGGRRSLWVGAAALLPIVWLGVVDAAACVVYLKGLDTTATGETADSRLRTAALGTAVVVPLIYAVFAAAGIGSGFEPDLLVLGLSVGLAWNVVNHLVLFCCLFLVAVLTGRMFMSAPFLVRYGAAAALSIVVLGYLAQRLFADQIGLTGADGLLVSTAIALSLAATVLGLRLRAFAVQGTAPASALDLVLGSERRPDAGEAAAFAIIIAAGWALNAVAARLDWDFTIAKLAAAAMSIAVFARLYRAAPRVAMGMPATVVVCLAPLAMHVSNDRLQRGLEAALGDPGFSVRHTLDRYLVYNPSFRLTDGLLRDAPDAPRFDRFLRANTGLPATASRPVDVDFVRPLPPSPSGARPWIFLFVIDSLRPDYLGAYNARAAFTPAIDRFARESTVFRRAFTRYGGTGLSMPSIWMGAAGVHTQYVEPFRPMNALEKLLDANGYERHVSLDHIMGQLLTPSPLVRELDRGVPEMSIDFCRTLSETEGRIAAARSPVFVHSRSLNLHVAAIRASADPAGEIYPGFEPRYASRVHRMDGCFGAFVDFLKRRGIYDDSIVVLTADHGEELGADGRWGHAYYLFPGVVEVPLIVHLPRSGAPAAADVGAAAFTTDITPTLYAALGYRPTQKTLLMGRPLVGELDATSSSGSSVRRRSNEVVIASYGAVYGTLTRNGSRLYIADANHGAEYAYERVGNDWRQVPVTAGTRAVGQRLIREYVEEIAREYQVHGTG